MRIPCKDCITLSVCMGRYSSTFNQHNQNSYMAVSEVERYCKLLTNFIFRVGEKGKYIVSTRKRIEDTARYLGNGQPNS